MAVIFALLLALAMSIHGVGQQPLTSNAGGFGSLSLITEQTDAVVLASHHDLSQPFPILAVPRNPSIDRGGALLARDVLAVTGSWDGSQVRPSAVQAVPVDVVTLGGVARVQPEQRAVQQYPTPFGGSLFAHGVPVFVNMPGPAPRPLGVNGVDDGVGPSFPTVSRQRQQGGQSILIQDGDTRNRARTPLALTSPGAVVPLLDLTGAPGDWTFAVVTCNRDALDGWSQGSPDHQTAPFVAATFIGTEETLALIGGPDAGQEVGAASTADARNGTLLWHRQITPAGEPRAVDAAPGHLRTSILPRLGAQF